MEGIQYGIQQGYNPVTAAAYPFQQYAGQQGLFGGPANPLTGLMGSGIPGLFSSQNLGRQPGQVTDGGMFQYGSPYGNIDPLNAALMPQTQWGQPGLFGQQQPHLQQLAQLAQQVQLAQLLAQQQLGRLPFGLDPISAAVVQQRAQVGPQPQLAPWLGISPVNRIDPITAAYIQQAQIAQLYQQLALQGQLGQPNQFGHPFGQGYLGQGQFGLGQLGQGPGQNPWANPQLATQFGRTAPWQFGTIGAIGNYGGQPPIC